MADKYKLQLKNFRSIRDVEIDIAPLTVVYGPNGSGKSSLIYGLLTLKNFLTNPNQNIPSLFSYPTLSLGGFEEVVSGHNRDAEIALALAVSSPSGSSEFTLGIAQSGGMTAIEADINSDLWDPFDLSLDIALPYQANQAVSHMIYSDTSGYIGCSWNGITLNDDQTTSPFHEQLPGLLTTANMPMELSKSTGFVPLRRGFTSPAYSVSHVTPTLSTDAEVASLLATDRYLEYAVSGYMESIANRQLRARMQVGTSSFNIDSIPRNGRTPVSLVNEGFGINQIAYLLTVCLHPNSKVVAIEEPEIHLHPSMVRKLVHAMVDITSNMDKRIIVSTHSETFVLSLLAQIASGKVSVDGVSFIFAEKEDGVSKFTKQEASPDGQLEGGVSSFISSQFEDIAAFLGLNSKTDQS